MSEELKSNENVGALQPDALAQIASVDPSPAVGGMHPFTPAMLSRLKKQRQLLSELEHALKSWAWKHWCAGTTPPAAACPRLSSCPCWKAPAL